MSVAEAPRRERAAWSPARLDRGERIRAVIIVALLLLVLFALPARMSAYWTNVATQVAIFSVVSLGLGTLIGRVGLVSLGQYAVLALGAWVGARLCFATGLPFPMVLLLTGLITMVLGTLVGLPALRLSGLYLALITLMLAAAITVVLNATNFPNGGKGFLGHVENDFGNPEVRRPSIAETDPAYFRYAVIVAVVLFLIALLHVRGKPGRAWAAIRQSEPAALAAGVNITLYKLWAFALASFMTGVAGGVLAGDVGELFVQQFPTSNNIVLLAVVLMGGVYSIWGAIVAGALFKLLPALLDNWGLPADLLTILFGVGILQVLLTAPAGLVYQFPRDMKRLGGALLGLARRVGIAGGRAS
ncbi:MAG: branched-chain amino acid transport system permease protein [Thermoleophilaceae bacterium]|nr:branched-chain amino acid transport system permease protein [Thermoleophilaceae bacterium]